MGIYDGGPAFPAWNTVTDGMSVRDFAAIMFGAARDKDCGFICTQEEAYARAQRFVDEKHRHDVMDVAAEAALKETQCQPTSES